MDNEKELTHIDLFSGIGGFTLAGEWAGFKTIAFCEKEEFCQKVLQKRFGAVIADTEYLRKLQSERSKQKKWEWISKHPILIPEIRNLDGTKYRGATLLTGGFPCQPFSVAGKKRGKEDDRYLWPEMRRVISEAKPRWILAENVPGIFRMALDTVLSDLESEGYSTGTFIIPACSLNAPHRRNRVWIVANSIGTGTGNQDREANDQGGQISQDRQEGIRQNDGTISSSRLISTNKNASDSKRRRCEWGRQKQVGERRKVADGTKRTNSDVADSQCLGWQEGARERIEHEKQVSKGQNIGDGDSKGIASSSEGILSQGLNGGQGQGELGRNYWEQDWYEVATRFCRVDDGISYRVHRLKALGNAIVPQIAYEILKNIAWIEKELAQGVL